MAYAKSEKSAAQILDAATRVFALKGYARASLQDVAEAAEMSKGALHYHFPTKEALVVRVLESCLNAIAERTLHAWSDGQTKTIGGTPFDALRLATRELWMIRRNRTTEVAVVSDMLAQSLHDEVLKKHLAEYYASAAKQVTDNLGPILPFLALKPRVPLELIPRLLVGLLDGLVMQHYLAPDAINDEALLQASELMARALFEEIGASP